MNRQQAINYLLSSGFSEEQINTIEQAFKQEPTTKNDLGVDAVSREAVLDLIADYDLSMGQVVRGIHALPSVTPQEPKTGHWIEHPEIETSTPEYLMFYECSECGDKQCFCKSDIHKKHFCNNCGARMVEPQESEDKE